MSVCRARSALVVLAATAVALAGCSSSGHPKPSATTSSAPTTSTTPTSTPPASSSTPAPASSSSEQVTEAALAKLLVTPTDLKLTGATSTPAPNTNSPLPCAAAGSQSLNEQVPATVRAGTDITDDAVQAALSEEIRVYPDTATATRAFGVVNTGLSCKTGTLQSTGGSKVAYKIGTPEDLKTVVTDTPKLAEIEITDAKAWPGTAAGEEVDIVAVALGRTLVLFIFQSPVGADTSKLPAPQTVIQTALEKIVTN